MAFVVDGITNYIGGYVNEYIGGAIRTGGGFAGDAFGSVGNGINSFGGGVEKSIRRYGDAVKDYGNGVKDWTGADGPRNTTAANPLGLSDNITGGKRALGSFKVSSSPVNSSPAYRAPNTVGTRSAIKPSANTRALPAPVKKAAANKVTNIPAAKSSTSNKVPIAGIPVKKKAVTGIKPGNGTSKAGKTTAAIKPVPMAGPSVTRDQAIAKKS